MNSFSPRSFTGIACSSAVACLTRSVKPRFLAILAASRRWLCLAKPVLDAAWARYASTSRRLISLARQRRWLARA